MPKIDFHHNVLIVGGGGREAALAYALKKSQYIGQIHAAPGSDGMGDFVQCMVLDDPLTLVDHVHENAISLVIFGSEAGLVRGDADHLRAAGVAVIGASKAAAQLEGSKAFLKSVLFEAGVPCAASQSFTDLAQAQAYLKTRSMPIVLKTDGLAAGKGVVICETEDVAQAWLVRYLSGEAFGAAGQCVVIEDYLSGPEISMFFLVDAKGTAHYMASARDHKRIFDHDLGPNTGGMGAITPVAEVDEALVAKIQRTIIAPTLSTMENRGMPFQGFLFAGLMLTQEGPKLLEYNVRLGDPETQIILQDLGVDLLDWFLQAAHDAAQDLPKMTDTPTRVNVVMAAKNYPDTPEKGALITGLETLVAGEDYFHAGSEFLDGKWRVNGGRVLNILGVGQDVHEARKNVYAKLAKIYFDGMQYRGDIGLEQKGE